MIKIAFTLYCMNMVVGILAAAGKFHFKKVHHILYFLVILSAVIASISNFKNQSIAIIVLLILLPKLKTHSIWHPVAASIGFVFYVWWMVDA